jgi:hypothetical protein
MSLFSKYEQLMLYYWTEHSLYIDVTNANTRAENGIFIIFLVSSENIAFRSNN